MAFLAKLLLKAVIAWIATHPERPFSRWMRQQVGPRTDVARLTRLERLQHGIAFLLWGVLFAGLLFLPALWVDPRTLPADNVWFPLWIFSMAILAGMGLLAGFYLLVRALI